MKRFSTEKYLQEGESLGIPRTNPDVQLSLETWIPECEGKTRDECTLLGFMTKEEWFEEVEED